MGKTSKVVVFGTKKCGKTSILEQVIYGKLGVSYSNKIYYRQAGKILPEMVLKHLYILNNFSPFPQQ